jgi:ADP-heptose:LPS heptosyltransferase
MIAQRLRHDGYEIKVACDPDQRPWWVQSGESSVQTPRSVPELFDLVKHAGVFVGNDSGPGHLAAACGVPTLSIFGPQVPEWFVPLHPQAEFIEGQPCEFKPCSDYCSFIEARCIIGVEEMEVLRRARAFLEKHSQRVLRASVSAGVTKSL